MLFKGGEKQANSLLNCSHKLASIVLVTFLFVEITLEESNILLSLSIPISFLNRKMNSSPIPASDRSSPFPQGSWDLESGLWTPSLSTWEFSSRSILRKYLTGFNIYYLGDSVSLQIAKASAALLDDCLNPINDCEWKKTWMIDADKTYKLIPSSELGECPDRVLCSDVLRLQNNISLRFLRYESFGRYTYEGKWPFFQQLFLDPIAPNTVVVFNAAHHDLHFYASADEFINNVRSLLLLLQSTPRWHSPEARASGTLLWRSLTPTEHPAGHKLMGMKAPVDFHRDVDSIVTNMWRNAGFPVANVSSMVFHTRGNFERTLTYDSVHFMDKFLGPIAEAILSQVCCILDARRRVYIDGIVSGHDPLICY